MNSLNCRHQSVTTFPDFGVKVGGVCCCGLGWFLYELPCPWLWPLWLWLWLWPCEWPWELGLDFLYIENETSSRFAFVIAMECETTSYPNSPCRRFTTTKVRPFWVTRTVRSWSEAMASDISKFELSSWKKGTYVNNPETVYCKQVVSKQINCCNIL